MGAPARKRRTPSAPPLPEAALAVVLDRPRTGTRENVRLFEWVTASIMVGMSGIIALSPEAIDLGGFHMIRNVGLTPAVFGAVLMLAGVGRLGALYVNGRSVTYGPRLRATGAFLGFLLWLQMFYSLAVWSLSKGYFTIGAAVYVGLAIGEAISIFRAASDVRPCRP